MKNVFVINTSGHDYNSAKKYGKLVPLTVGNINPLQVDRLMMNIARVMLNSKPDDYLLLSGHSVITAIAASLFFSKHGQLNLLIWNKNTSEYLMRRITGDAIEEITKLIKEEEK